MKKFLASLFGVGMFLSLTSPAMAEFPIKMGDTVPVTFFCIGPEAGTALGRSVEEDKNFSSEVMALQEAGICTGWPMPFPAIVIDIVGFYSDWEGDDFVLIEVGGAGMDNMYTVVWAHHVAQEGQSI